MPGEPGGAGLPEALAAVLPPSALLLPVLTPDRDLDWAAYDGALHAGGTLARLREPPGRGSARTRSRSADIVLVPALAVDATGARLGRGGGSYDRALARVRPDVPVVALLYPGEMVPVLPAEPHDRPVTAVLTPAGLLHVGPDSSVDVRSVTPAARSRPDSGRTAAGTPPLALEVSECQSRLMITEANVPTYQYACTACAAPARGGAVLLGRRR